MKENSASYAPFPQNPTVSVIGGLEVYNYLSEGQVNTAIDSISSQINFTDFDTILVNIEGAKYLFERLAKKAGYKGKAIEIEYHGHNNELKKDKPVPENLYGKKCLIIDDIYDSGHTLNSILKEGLSPDSVCVTLISKRIKGKESVPNIIVGLEIDDVWIAGCGMDSKGEHDELFRTLPRIIAIKS
jgi:hypoxanthine-guanine phosphoribosyltransferase